MAISLLLSAGIGMAIFGGKEVVYESVPGSYSVNVLYEVTGATVVSDNEVLNNYPSLNFTLVDDSLELYQNGNLVVQGITMSDDFVMTSSYDADGIDNSVVVTMDKESGNLVNVCELDNDAHVGGIAYDDANGLVWVTGKCGEVNAYDYDDVTKFYQVNAKYAKLDVGKGLKNYKYPWANSAAFLCVDNGDLYVGSFQVRGTGLVKKYKVEIDKVSRRLSLVYDTEFAIPSKVQGMTFYRNGDNTYLLFSRSFGRQRSSIIQIFKYDEQIDDYSRNVPYVYYKAPTMLEQITVDDDNLYTVYESAATLYSDGKEQIDTICVFDLPKLTRRL